MLPPIEMRLLRGLSVQAVEMALDGYPAEGYTTLAEELGRVMALRDFGEPWGEELVGQYHRLMDEYARLYNIARE